jgi:hypothetical protein
MSLKLNDGTVRENSIYGTYNNELNQLTQQCQGQISNCWQPQPYTYWGSYPVYINTDRTKKAIDILKALEADKTISFKSVSKFIELTEKIAKLLE